MINQSKVVAKTTASNRKMRVLLTAIRNESLIPRPEFQRRLVWTNRDKINFLRTVLEGYPFPEIYIASGSVDTDTGEGSEMLVDGQQRMTTLYQYFTGSSEIRLPHDLPPYIELGEKGKLEFLEYDVVVRDLGPLTIDEIKEVFTRINSTKYSLNAMEINNARYEGALKKFAEDISKHSLFEVNRVFSASDIRRMEDVLYVLVLLSTILGGYYFNRDSEVEKYLQEFNDEFPIGEQLQNQLEMIFKYLDDCNFPSNSRVWKKADLFSLIVELYKAAERHDGYLPEVSEFSPTLQRFYEEVDSRDDLSDDQLSFQRGIITAYGIGVLQGSNNRSTRIERGQILSDIIESSYS